MLNKTEITRSHPAGMADLEARQPVNADTSFHWASITKTLTAVSITLVGHAGHQAGFAAFSVMNPRNSRAVIAAFNTSHAESDLDAYGKSNAGFGALLQQAIKLVQ